MLRTPTHQPFACVRGAPEVVSLDSDSESDGEAQEAVSGDTPQKRFLLTEDLTESIQDSKPAKNVPIGRADTASISRPSTFQSRHDAEITELVESSASSDQASGSKLILDPTVRNQERGAELSPEINGPQSDIEVGGRDPAVARPARTPATCLICLSRCAVYVCPGCRIKTCSVSCARRHTERDGCTGRAPPAINKPLKQMGEADLLRDLSFLQETGRMTESAARLDSIIQGEKFGIQVPSAMPMPQDIFKSNESDERPATKRRRVGESAVSDSAEACFARSPSSIPRGIVAASVAAHAAHAKKLMTPRQLRFKATEDHVLFRACPAGLHRRRSNTTCLSKQKKLKWRVEWIVKIGDDELVLIDKAVANSQSINGLISRFADAINVSTVTRQGRQELSGLKSALSKTDDLVVLMKDHGLPRNIQGFLRLNKEQNLRDCLAGSVIIEYPTFFVTVASEVEPLDSESSDDSSADSSSSSSSEEEDDKDSQAYQSAVRSPWASTPAAGDQPGYGPVAPATSVQTAIRPGPPEDPRTSNLLFDDHPAAEDDDVSPSGGGFARTNWIQEAAKSRGPVVGCWKGAPVYEKLSRFVWPDEAAPQQSNSQSGTTAGPQDRSPRSTEEDELHKGSHLHKRSQRGRPSRPGRGGRAHSVVSSDPPVTMADDFGCQSSQFQGQTTAIRPDCTLAKSSGSAVSEELKTSPSSHTRASLSGSPPKNEGGAQTFQPTHLP